MKIEYESIVEGMTKPEKTKITIYPGRMFVSYNVPGKAESTVKKMKEDGRTNVLFSRGIMIQTFPGKTEQEVYDIAIKDIDNGVEIAGKQTGKKVTISNLKTTK